MFESFSKRSKEQTSYVFRLLLLVVVALAIVAAFIHEIEKPVRPCAAPRGLDCGAVS